MTCQECEIKLGMGEHAAEHLASCEECRWLAEELRLNRAAMREMRVRRMHWEWALAAAAGIAMAIGVWKVTWVEKLPMQPVRVAVVVAEKPLPAGHGPAPHRRVKRHLPSQAPTEPLRVKMFTSDPDVVIYWIVDRKAGSE